MNLDIMQSLEIGNENITYRCGSDGMGVWDRGALITCKREHTLVNEQANRGHTSSRGRPLFLNYALEIENSTKLQSIVSSFIPISYI